MSVVAISESIGSLGTEIGQAVAATLGYEFADREILTKAAEHFGEGIFELTHATEEKPTLWERLTDTQHRYTTYVEATMFELAARDNAVLVGRACTVVLGQIPHVLRVRITAPEAVRAQRVQQQHGLSSEAALDYVRRTDRERAARVKFLYHVDWEDPLLYDLMLNTERATVDEGARLVREALRTERFQSTAASSKATRDLNLVAQAKAALMANAITRSRPISVTSADGVITLSGVVDAEQVWATAQDVVARVPGVISVRNEVAVPGYGPDTDVQDEEGHGQFRHGEERSWGGYGGGWSDRERAAHERHVGGASTGQTPSTGGPAQTDRR
jgi:cytidylate kinase